MARERKFNQEELYKTTKELLLKHGYEGFSFTLLAEQLDVSRAALYKYFSNKEELITDYMIFEMNLLHEKLKAIDSYAHFEEQFNYLITTIFQHKNIHEILGMAYYIPVRNNNKVKVNIQKLKNLHLDMHIMLEGFIQLGREENRLKEDLNSQIILGFIFQTIAIPNHFGIPHSDWVTQIKKIISHGIFTSSN